MANIKINETSFSGNNVIITNGRVIINGKEIKNTEKQINIVVEGDIDQLKADACDKISVVGSVKSISTQSGDVDGSISTMSGDVDCGMVNGSISTMFGDIKHKKN